MLKECVTHVITKTEDLHLLPIANIQTEKTTLKTCANTVIMKNIIKINRTLIKFECKY